jgi:hypothetical protein
MGGRPEWWKLRDQEVRSRSDAARLFSLVRNTGPASASLFVSVVLMRSVHVSRAEAGEAFDPLDPDLWVTSRPPGPRSDDLAQIGRLAGQSAGDDDRPYPGC